MHTTGQHTATLHKNKNKKENNMSISHKRTKTKTKQNKQTKKTNQTKKKQHIRTNYMDDLSKQDKITDTLTQEGNSRGIRFSAGRSYYQ